MSTSCSQCKRKNLGTLADEEPREVKRQMAATIEVNGYGNDERRQRRWKMGEVSGDDELRIEKG